MKGGLTMAGIASADGDSVKRAGELEAAGKLEEAQACLDRVLAATPNDPEAVHLGGVLAFRRGRVEEAVALMERSIELGPRNHFLRNICEAYRILGRYDEALAAGRRAAAGDPRDPICEANLSVLHYERAEPEEAIAAAERSLAIKPDHPGSHMGLAEALLVSGQFERGWDEYEWRYRLAGVPSPMPLKDVPAWDGADLAGGSLLLVADQGYGDGIQFARYIPWAAERCGKVMLAASKELQPLLRQVPGIDTMFDQWDACPPVKAWQTLSGLPRLHGTTAERLPASPPYLAAEPDRVAAWEERLKALCAPGYARVGLVWAGRPTHMNDRNRTVTLAGLSAITDLAGVTFVSLQKGAAVDQIGGYFGRAPLVNLGPEIEDFADSAAVIQGLDLVITVDTSVAHVAGAIGKPAWVMLPHAPDWRWLRERSDSPWYPSLRLFRPPGPRDWPAVTAAVAKAFAAGEWKTVSAAERAA